MTIAAPPPGLQPEDYEEIEAAVLETARGRWFLAEYARRLRSAESARLHAALERLERRLEARQAPADAFSVAERLMELSWSLRERGVEDFVCGRIEALAREFDGGRGAPQAAPPAGTLCDRPDLLARHAITVEAAPVQAPQAEPPRAATLARLVTIAPEPQAAPAADPRLAPLSWLDRLPLVDRLALFS